MSRKGGYQIIDFKGLHLRTDIVSDKLRNLILKSDKVLLVSGLRDGSKLLPDCICSKIVLKNVDEIIPDTILLISNDKIFEINGEADAIYCFDTKFYDITPYLRKNDLVDYDLLETGQGTEITRIYLTLLDYPIDGIKIDNALIQVRYNDEFVVTENNISSGDQIKFYLDGIYDSSNNPIDLDLVQIYVQL